MEVKAEEVKPVEVPTPGGIFTDAFDAFEFDWTPDGEHVLRETGIPALAPVEPEKKEEPALEAAPVEPEAKVEDKPSEVETLKAEVDKLKVLMEAVDKPKEVTEAPQPQRTLADIIAGRDIMDIYADPAEAEKFEQEKFAAQMAPFIDAMRPMMVQWRVGQEVKEMFGKYGKDFEERIPMIKTLSQKRPDLSMQAAYDLIKDIPLPAPADAKTGQVEAKGSPEPPPVIVDAAAEARAIAEKAAKLITEQGVAGTDERTEQISTVSQAVDAAVRELA